jgi:hypothetical protein
MALEEPHKEWTGCAQKADAKPLEGESSRGRNKTHTQSKQNSKPKAEGEERTNQNKKTDERKVKLTSARAET